MPSNYPGALDTFTTKVDYTMYEVAADLNHVQDAISALEGTLGLNPQGSYATVLARLAHYDTLFTGAVTLDASPGDIGVLTVGSTASAGAIGKAADAGHVHLMPAFAGTGGALTIARSDHTHSIYLPLAGGILTGLLTTQAISVASGYNVVGAGPNTNQLQQMALGAGVAEVFNNYGTITLATTIQPGTYRGIEVVLGASLSLTFGANNLVNGLLHSFTLIVLQDVTGGRALTWGSTIRWPNGVVPTISTAANARTVFTFTTVDGGATWDGFLAGSGMA